MAPRIAIVAPGGMGSALAERLSAGGAEVLTSLAGRSEASRSRAAASGMKDVGDEGLADTDIILSVVPPDQALPLAERLAAALRHVPRKPVYVDCNAVGPELASAIGRAIDDAGLPFADAGLIGLPPRPGSAGPTLFVSGPHGAAVAATLAALGLQTQPLEMPNGAASALKMGYAGITKGLIALAATMALAAEREGVGEALAAELARSQPDLFRSFGKSVPDMLGKARRWVPEMREIERFVGPGVPSAAAYGAFAGLYEQVADQPDLHAMLRDFYKARDSGVPA